MAYDIISSHRNREFIAALQGIKSGHQGIYLPDQGIPRWPPFHCDVNRLSEHSPTMNRMPEKNELHPCGAGVDRGIHWPRDVDVNSVARG
jgi:hypothetical protein